MDRAVILLISIIFAKIWQSVSNDHNKYSHNHSSSARKRVIEPKERRYLGERDELTVLHTKTGCLCASGCKLGNGWYHQVAVGG